MTTKAEKTTENSHRATQRGYAGGLIIERGEFVPLDVTLSDVWLIPASQYRAADYDELTPPERLMAGAKLR